MDDDDSVLAAGVFAVVDFGESRGLSREALMKTAGLTEALRADPDARVSPFAWVVLWRELIVGLPDAIVPLELTRALRVEHLGLVGQLVRCADHLQHAIDLGNRYRGILDPKAEPIRIECGDLVGCGVRHLPEVHALRFPIELMLGWSFRVISIAAGGPIALHEVTFAHAPHYPVEPYAELFGAPVRFGAEVDALWLTRDELQRPFPAPDPQLLYHLERHAASLLQDMPLPVDELLVKLRTAIAAELATSGADLERVARKLAMSSRSLQRRLGERSTSFQDVVDTVRLAAAKRLLGDHARSILEVAFELGYGDLKSFYRAFKRWTGTTPAQWRRQ